MVKTITPRIAAIDTRAARSADRAPSPYTWSAEHKSWRRLVLKRAGGKCEWPGCGRAEKRMFADHIVELKDGGAPLDPANGQCLCGKHHTLKTHQARLHRLRE